MPRGGVRKLDTLAKVKARFQSLGVTIHAMIVDGVRGEMDRVPPQTAKIEWGCSVEGCTKISTAGYRYLAATCKGKCSSCAIKKGVECYDKFVALLQSKGYTMIAEKSECVNAMSMVPVQCPDSDHPSYKTSYNRFSNNHGCRKCHNAKSKVSLEDVKQRFQEKGFFLEEQIYVDAHTPMKCACRCGRHIMKAVSNLNENTYGCKDCVNKYILSEIEDMCEEAGCILETGDNDPEFYINTSKILYHCPCGNPELACTTIKSFRKGSRCVNCVRRHIEETNLLKYGTKNVGASQHTKEKSKKTNMEKRGVEHHSQDKECRDRTTQTCIEKYGGVGNAGALREKHIDKCRELYDSDFYLHSEHWKNTMLKKYGVIHPLQNAEIFAKKLRSSFANKPYLFPSGRIGLIQGYEHRAIDELLESGVPEDDIVVGAENVPKVLYPFEGKIKTYYPDIYIRSQNKLIEVKSEYTLTLQEEKNYAKFFASSRLYRFEAWVYDDKKKVKSIICTSDMIINFLC